MGEILCSQCGKANPSDAVLCRYCSAPLIEAATPSAAASEPLIPQEKGSEEPLPDWLRELSAPLPSQPSPPSEGPPLPDWLKELGAVAEQAEEERGVELPSEPAWLDLPEKGAPPTVYKSASVEEESPLEEETTLAEALTNADTSLPHWMSATETPGEQEPPPSPPEEQLAPPEAPLPSPAEAPLTALGTEEETPLWTSPAEETAAAAPAEGIIPSRLSPPQFETPFPTEEAIAPPSPPAQPFTTPPFLEEDLSWLSELEAALPGVPAEEEIEAEGGTSTEESQLRGPFLLDSDLSSWLAISLTEEETAPPAETPEEALQPAELPSWVQAMRPSPLEGGEPAAPPGEEEHVEGVGPLAGIRGVLPAEPDVAQATKPRFLGQRLQVSQAQETQAAHLRELIAAETQPIAIPAQPLLGTGWLLRLGIAFLLVLPILLTQALQAPGFPYPMPTAEILAVQRLVEAQTNTSVVLLAVDYQPAYAPELDTLASTVLTHLWQRQALVLTLSTLPNGPLQAERLASLVRAKAGLPREGENLFVNLGYLPGGPLALASLAQQIQTALPQEVRGENPWENPRLRPLERLDQLSLVIVAVEDPQRARIWVEQISPTLRSTPMIMLTSAQVEVLVRPYLEAQPSQVQGLLSGWSGGAAYERARARSGPVSGHWAAFSTAVFNGGLLLILGSLVAIAQTGWARLKERRAAHRAGGAP